MRRKLSRIVLFVVILFMFNYNPDNIDGRESGEKVYSVSSSRIVNSLSEDVAYEYLDRVITGFMRNWEIQGASVAISRNGKLVFAKGYGYVDGDGGERIEPYNRFRIASISKLITAAAIMQLVEDGRLGLNDQVFGVEGILSDDFYANPLDSRVNKITVSHLLSHQGGWTTRWGDQMFMPYVVASALNKEPPVSTEEIVRFALDKRLHFSPGTGRSYSNLGYSILGLVIEKVTGMSYQQYCKDQLFEPSGIYDFDAGRNLLEDRLPFEVRYFEPSNSIPQKSIYNENKLVPLSYGGNDIEALGGAGVWITTAPDLLKFVLSIDGFDSKPDILSQESIAYMTNSGNGVAPVGWKGTTNNGYWWRTGSFAGTSAMVRRQPDGLVWVVLFNTNTWKQSMFPTDISRMMARALGGTRSWPVAGSDIIDNLFDYSLPLPLSTIANH